MFLTQSDDSEEVSRSGLKAVMIPVFNPIAEAVSPEKVTVPPSAGPESVRSAVTWPMTRYSKFSTIVSIDEGDVSAMDLLVDSG